ncbi:hypothetical protein QUC31_007478 [Theobroma cacao]|uniref:DNAJ heat shock N-terminal domain-containing protein, putative n=1 Tax=Theobroma cacao TaxID=3641 RepID=A0A061FXW0_THECC|nr:DNAJ heat shock N-terminal domain-containing protein, putative [Theobroma cacao]
MAGDFAAKIKAYIVPLILFSLAMLCQLVLLPRSFPPSHYDVLGIKTYSSMEAVKEAYENLESKWNSGLEVPTTTEFIKIRYAYELLTNPIWKRNYDVFGIDEQLHVVEKVSQQYAEEKFSNIELPLLHVDASDIGDDAFNMITSNDFQSMFQDSKPWLLQVYSSGSSHCAQFSNSWKRIAALLNGVANIGMVELSEIQIAAYLAEKKPTGQFFFRNGLPSLVTFPSGCKTSDCLIRFEGELSVDAVTDWFAMAVLNLPRIFYYSKESLGPRFLAKSSPHKVKVIFFSKTGERATPVMRQAAKDYWNYATFACVLWREEEFSVWWTTFGVESAPAIVFLKDPGLKPLVYHGSVNDSWFLDVLEQNKQQVLPQLRSLTSKELGCDARGYSRAGRDTLTWYCAILAGRQGLELDSMRETMRRVQETLSKSSESNAAIEDEQSITAAVAFKNKRLTFSWLDGEAQKNYCFFYLNTENGYETCGPRRVPTDVPQLFIIRYERNASEDAVKVEKAAKSIWEFHQHEVDPAAQLSVTYNGSAEVSQIIQWISNIIKDGDTRNLPFYRVKTPELVPEDTEPFWSRGQQSILSKSMGTKQKMQGIIIRLYDYLGDPRIGPALLLGSLMSFGSIWLMRSQQNRPVQSSQPSQADNDDKPRPRERRRRRNVSNNDMPPSVTDLEPRDSYQMPLSDSD